MIEPLGLFVPFLIDRDFSGHHVGHTHNPPGLEDNQTLLEADIRAAWGSCTERHRYVPVPLGLTV